MSRYPEYPGWKYVSPKDIELGYACVRSNCPKRSITGDRIRTAYYIKTRNFAGEVVHAGCFFEYLIEEDI